MIALPDTLFPAHLGVALARTEPCGDLEFHAFRPADSATIDRLDRLPGGIFLFGDVVASCNPKFGQAMRMTSLQAGHLQQALESRNGELARVLCSATTKTTYLVLAINTYR
ncbi:hypothetical protein [Mycobacterium lepromatosis]|uniref:hypothetical protein n=1 Tax=Mycobacterium lepromatosis TaxID=480418 RepID=UPI001F160EB6|nr:hypothetical protein [Mycobacterium lepromatosis]